MPSAETPVPVPCLLHQDQSVIQSATAVSNFQSSGLAIGFAEIPLRQIKSCRATFTFCLGIAHVHQAHFSVGGAFTATAAATAVRSLRHFWMLPAPSILPAVQRSHRSFRSPVPNSVLQVAVVQVAVAQAVAQEATPNHCNCCCYPSQGGAGGCLRPQGDVSCAEAPHPLVLWT